MDTIIGVILGWLFGMLGQRPIIYIQNSFKKRPLKKSFFVELKTLNAISPFYRIYYIQE